MFKIIAFFFLYWSACIKSGKWAVMYILYLFLRGIDFSSFYDFGIWFRNCSESAVFCVTSIHVISNLLTTQKVKQRKKVKQEWSTISQTTILLNTCTLNAEHMNIEQFL